MSSTAGSTSPAATDEQRLEADEAAQEEQLMRDFPPLDDAVLQRCRAATADDILKVDTDVVIKGMNMFFFNNFAEAEELFGRNYREDPLCASALGTLGTIRAMLSMEPDDINSACKCLVYASQFGKKVIPPRSTIANVTSAIGNWWYSRKPEKLSPSEFRANVVMGEAELLRANLLLMEDTFSGYLKAGLALRRAYGIYDYLQKYIGHYPTDHGADANSLNGMHFGLGAIHVVTSILPPKILAILKALGYMHDREKGFVHLHTCLRSRTLRSPIASLFLLAFHGLLPAFAALTTDINVPIAEEVIKETLAVYPKSVIHLWLAGRVQRLKKDVSGSINIFSDCVAHSASLQSSLPQLKHFALYDLAQSYLAKGLWENARSCFEVLERESVWSKKFYAYAQGCCLDMLKKHDDAVVCYLRSVTQPSIKLGGKTISVDQFVKRRTEQMFRMQKTLTGYAPGSPKLPKLTASINLTKVPGIELAMLFNMFTQSESADLETMLNLTTDARKAAADAAGIPLAAAGDIASGADAGAVSPASDVVSAADTGLSPASPASPASPSSPDTTTIDDDEETFTSGQVDEELPIETYTDDQIEQLRHEEVLVLTLMRATLLRELGRFDEAREEYHSVEKPFRLKSKKPEFETWVVPYGYYEHAVMLYRAGDEAGCVDMIENKLKKKFSGVDFNFEMQLSFRLHLTNDLLKNKKK